MQHLSKISTTPPDGTDKEETIRKTNNLVKELGKLQDVLFAQKKFAVLIILQGTDASGKDGTVEHVFAGINPMGQQ